jgi:hypothetical protein
VAAQPSGADFFTRQHAARGTSAKLVVLFVLGVVSIVAAIDLLVLVAVRSSGTSSTIGWLVVATVGTLLRCVAGE